MVIKDGHVAKPSKDRNLSIAVRKTLKKKGIATAAGHGRMASTNSKRWCLR